MTPWATRPAGVLTQYHVCEVQKCGVSLSLQDLPSFQGFVLSRFMDVPGVSHPWRRRRSTNPALTAQANTVPTIPLCNKDKTCLAMPIIGQGSCCGTYNISSWLAAGGTHIDTSVDYGSQPTIAAAIAASGIPRSSLWITSKLNVESCSTDMSAALQTLVLAPLQTNYVDLLLLHHAGRWETDKKWVEDADALAVEAWG